MVKSSIFFIYPIKTLLHGGKHNTHDKNTSNFKLIGHIKDQHNSKKCLNSFLLTASQPQKINLNSEITSCLPVQSKVQYFTDWYSKIIYPLLTTNENPQSFKQSSKISLELGQNTPTTFIFAVDQNAQNKNVRKNPNQLDISAKIQDSKTKFLDAKASIDCSKMESVASGSTNLKLPKIIKLKNNNKNYQLKVVVVNPKLNQISYEITEEASGSLIGDISYKQDFADMDEVIVNHGLSYHWPGSEGVLEFSTTVAKGLVSLSRFSLKNSEKQEILHLSNMISNHNNYLTPLYNYKFRQNLLNNQKSSLFPEKIDFYVNPTGIYLNYYQSTTDFFEYQFGYVNKKIGYLLNSTDLQSLHEIRLHTSLTKPGIAVKFDIPDSYQIFPLIESSYFNGEDLLKVMPNFLKSLVTDFLPRRMIIIFEASISSGLQTAVRFYPKEKKQKD